MIEGKRDERAPWRERVCKRLKAKELEERDESPEKDNAETQRAQKTEVARVSATRQLVEMQMIKDL